MFPGSRLGTRWWEAPASREHSVRRREPPILTIARREPCNELPGNHFSNYNELRINKDSHAIFDRDPIENTRQP